MTTIVNSDNTEGIESLNITAKLMIIEITGYSFEYIDSLPLPIFNELLSYCTRRVSEKRSMIKALGVNIQEYI